MFARCCPLPNEVGSGGACTRRARTDLLCPNWCALPSTRVLFPLLPFPSPLPLLSSSLPVSLPTSLLCLSFSVPRPLPHSPSPVPLLHPSPPRLLPCPHYVRPYHFPSSPHFVVSPFHIPVFSVLHTHFVSSLRPPLLAPPSCPHSVAPSFPNCVVPSVHRSVPPPVVISFLFLPSFPRPFVSFSFPSLLPSASLPSLSLPCLRPLLLWGNDVGHEAPRSSYPPLASNRLRVPPPALVPSPRSLPSYSLVPSPPPFPRRGVFPNSVSPDGSVEVTKDHRRVAQGDGEPEESPDRQLAGSGPAAVIFCQKL